MKYKNILLGLGSFATIVSPISTIVACSGGGEEKVNSLLEILDTEQARVNKLTSSSSVTTTSVDAQVAVGTTFNEDVAIALGIDFNNFKIDKFNYTFQGSSYGIIITVKLKDNLLLVSSINPILINVIYVSSVTSKIQVETTNLVGVSFLFSGPTSAGKVIPSQSIPKQVEVSYAIKNDSSTPNNIDYKVGIPTNLSNRDIVHIKFAIKKEYEKTHTLPSGFNNLISKTVSGLKRPILITNLIKSSFSFIGTSGLGKIVHSNIPEEVQISYAKVRSGGNEPIDHVSYSLTAPIGLSNGDILHIKFSIKTEFETTHDFPSTFTDKEIQKRVLGLKTLVPTINLNVNLFSFSGTLGSGTIIPPSIPEQVEVYYATPIDGDPTSEDYGTTIPDTLSNGVVFIKFAIKRKYQTTHKFPSGFTKEMPKLISGLD